VAEAQTTTELTPAGARELATDGGAQIVDVRSDAEHTAGHVPGAAHIPLASLSPDAAGELDRSRPVIFICRSGDRSELAAAAFRASGWDSHSVAGGLLAWAGDGLPLEPEGAEVAARPNLPGA
jgi:rhodanese-related sulfurtransferase